MSPAFSWRKHTQYCIVHTPYLTNQTNIRTMKKKLTLALDAAFYLLVFVIIQFVVMAVAEFGLGYKYTAPQPAIVCSMISGALTIALFIWRKWTPVSRDYLNTRPFGTLVWVALLSIGAVVPVMMITDSIGAEMPDEYLRLYSGIMSHELGYFAIGIFAPVAEEIVFRGAVLRSLLKISGSHYRWIAILISALLFGICHGNQAQFVSALLLGMIIGWMYCRTGSIVPGIMFHWVNNTIAFVMFRLMPASADMKLIDFCGGDYVKYAIFGVCSLCVFVPSLYQLTLRMHK